MKTKRIYKARLLYYFVCKACGRQNSQSFKVRNQRQAKCRTCRKNKVPENQIPLFKPEGGDNA